MSNVALWELIGTQRQVAELSAQESLESFKGLKADLVNGVPLAVAVNIAKEVWGADGGSEKLKVQFSDSFPKKNGEIILYTGLPERALRLMTSELEGVTTYFSAIHDYIEKMVPAVLAKLISAEFSEEANAEINEFRKNCLKYTGYVADYFYEVKGLLDDKTVNKWEDVHLVTIEVENGDYLFIDSFKERLTEAHVVFSERTFYREERAAWNLNDFDWSNQRVGAAIKLPYLFGEWINLHYGDVVPVDSESVVE